MIGAGNIYNQNNLIIPGQTRPKSSQAVREAKARGECSFHIYKF